MFNSSLRVFSPLRTLTRAIEQPLAGLFVTLGLVVGGFPGLVTAAEAPATVRDSRISTAASTVSAENFRPLPDGVYLFGQAPEPEQIGASYLVFEVNSNRVVGAFYMPHSSFDCFNGQMGAEQLELTVINSYERTAYPHTVALSENASVATTGNASALVGLEGYHQIQQVSENDQRILATCQTDLRGEP